MEIQQVSYKDDGPEQKNNINRLWWLLDDKEIFQHLVPLYDRIDMRQRYRRVKNIRHARLYENMEIIGLQAGLYGRLANEINTKNRVTLNVTKSCIDTATSKIAKMKPRPMFLTIDGDWDKQERAKKLTKYFDGLFQGPTMKVYEKKQLSFRDGAIFGTGPLKLFVNQSKQIEAERCIIDELLVDDAEAIYGSPRTLYQMKMVDRELLAKQFPESEHEIRSVKGGYKNEVNDESSNDLVRVIEAWRLPSHKGAQDGRHVIVIDNCTLYARKYKMQRFPFVFDRWNSHVTGFYGYGLAEELIGIQLEINKLLRTIQLAQHIMCVPRVWIEHNSKVVTANINNEVAGVGKYVGQPPVATTWPAMSPEVYQHVENLYKKAYEITGISMLSAQSSKPAGLNSGAAIRTFQDVESDRFQIVSQQYEQSFLDITSLCIDLLQDGGKNKVKAVEGQGVENLEWDDIKLDEEEYDLRVFPTSILPTQPAGKLQTVQELVQAGFIPKDQAMNILDFPDLEAAMSLNTASYDVIKMMISEMLKEDGEYNPPEPYMDLMTAKKMTQLAYLRARSKKAPEQSLEMLRRFMSQCQDLMDDAVAQAKAKMAPPPGAMPPPDAGMPPDAAMATPEPLPQSELMPQV